MRYLASIIALVAITCGACGGSGTGETTTGTASKTPLPIIVTVPISKAVQELGDKRKYPGFDTTVDLSNFSTDPNFPEGESVAVLPQPELMAGISLTNSNYPAAASKSRPADRVRVVCQMEHTPINPEHRSYFPHNAQGIASGIWDLLFISDDKAVADPTIRNHYLPRVDSKTGETLGWYGWVSDLWLGFTNAFRTKECPREIYR